jgi:hypothetical protein
MKAYVLTTGGVFLLVVTAHIARVFSEGPHLLKEPSFEITSGLAVAFTIWAWRAFRQLSRRDDASS